jgi:hypothetical protein
MTPNEHFVRGFMHEIKLAYAPDAKEKRTYTIEGSADHLDKMEEVMATLDYLGMAGASREVKIGYDGDGRAALRFTRTNGKMKKPENLRESTDGSTIAFSID